MSKRKTTIEITEQVWKKLTNMKSIGDSFDTVLRRILKIEDLDKDD